MLNPNPYCNMKGSIIVQNLKCGGCANTIKMSLSKLEGIQNVVINVDKSEISFEHDYDAALVLVTKTLNNLGYPSLGHKNDFKHVAKSFVSCGMGRFSKS